MSLLRVSEGLDLVLISENEVLVKFGSRSYPSELIRDVDLTGVLGVLVSRALQGPVSAGELLAEVDARHREDAQSLVDELVARGILIEAAKSPVEQYLAYTFTGDTTLAERSVTVLGAGPVAAGLTRSLLQHGVGRVAILDHRESDDLWRRFLPLASQADVRLGTPAGMVLRDLLTAAGYGAVEAVDGELHDAASVERALEASDVAVLALEQSDLRLAHVVNRCCIAVRKPWILTRVDGNFGLVGPLFVPLHTACYNDYATLADSAELSPEMTRRYRHHVLRRGAGSFFPGLPVYADLVAGFASLAVVHFLIRDASFALGRALTLDFDRMLIDVEDVLKLPRCPVCGVEKSSYQPTFSPEVVTRAPSTPGMQVSGE
jgi:bacteriocin biosynthesis cyclodehydratase domain-containing protein